MDDSLFLRAIGDSSVRRMDDTIVWKIHFGVVWCNIVHRDYYNKKLDLTTINWII